MLQEREEKISSLQKSIQVQNDHVHKLTSKVEVMERRSKQTVQRFDLKLENAAHEKEMLKTQLKVLYEEMKKMSEDPIHQALRNNHRNSNSSANSNGSSSANTASTVHSGRSEEEEILSQIMPAGNPFEENSSSSNISGNSNNNNSTGSNSAHSRNSTERGNGNSDEDEKIKLANSAQAILLQSQLYQALTSLKQLRQQTRGMKANYDAVVSSLQNDLVQCMDEKVRSETGLLSQLQSLEHSSRVREEGLREEMKNKDTRIERLMRRIGVLDKIDDDGSLSYMSDDVSVMGGDGNGNGNGKEQVDKDNNEKADAEETVDIDCGDTTSAILDHFTTPAGVGSRSLSSRISDLHSPNSVTANLWKDTELKSPVSFRNQHQDHNPIFKEYSDSFTKRARASATRIMAASSSVSAPKNKAAPRLISQNETRNNARAILERSQSRAKMILEKTASTLSSKPTPTPIPIAVNEVESALAELEGVTEAEVDFGAEESTEGDELGLMLDGEDNESTDVELEIADAFKGRSGSHDEDDDPDLR